MEDESPEIQEGEPAAAQAEAPPEGPLPQAPPAPLPDDGAIPPGRAPDAQALFNSGKGKGRGQWGDGEVDAAAQASSGRVSNPLLLKHERLMGTISKYIPSSGGGTVKSDMFEGEIAFTAESIMPECQSYAFREGEPVEFDVQSDERGRPHGVMVKPVVSRKPTECLGQRHRGYVRRFADRWGFLNAAAFDGDLFVHRDNLLLAPDQVQDGQIALRQGQAVEFDVALDDRGRTVAKQITTSALQRPIDWVGRRLQGYVRSFQGAWGFLNSDRFAGDLFVHRDSLLPQYQGLEFTSGTIVEFDVEKDHHKKGGKNRLVARQVAVLGGPTGHTQALVAGGCGEGPPVPGMPQHGVDPMAYPGGYHGAAPYGSMMNPQAASFTPYQAAQSPYYPGAQMAPPQQPLPGPVGYGQAPYPYPDSSAYGQQAQMPPQMPLPPQPAPAPYGQMPMMPGTQPQYGQPGLAQPPMPQQPLPGAAPYAQPPYGGQVPYGGQPPYVQLPYGQPGAVAAPQPPVLPQQPVAQGVPGESPAAQMNGFPQPDPRPAQPPADGGAAAPATGPDGQGVQVLLHITTHDWQTDQSGQLRVSKGTLVNVSHRAEHGWVYAATVRFGETNEPASEGWVPQAVAKRVSLARVEIDWPAEGPETMSLAKGDLIAVSKEAERGWVYGERISPRREGWASEGWLPKKVLHYVLM